MIKTFFSKPSVRIGLISLVSALLLVYLFLIPRNSSSYRAVPSQTSALIEFNGLINVGQQLRQLNDAKWKEVLKTPLLQNCWSEIGEVEQVFHHDASARSAFAKNKLLAAYSLHLADSLHPLFVLDMGESTDLDEILETNTFSRKFFPYQFRSQTLYTVHLPESGRTVVAQKGRLLLFSRYSYLVEDALTQLESARGWWADNNYLGDLNPKASLRMFFRPSKWQAQHQGSLLPEARGIFSTLSKNLVWLGIAWDGVKLSAMGEASGFLAGLGAWNGEKRGEIFSLLPDNTAFFTLAGFDNRSLFYKQLTDKPMADFERFVLPWIGHEAALVVTEPLSAAMSDDRLLLISVSDSARVRESLESYGEARGFLTHDKAGMFDIFGFQDQSLLTPFFSDLDATFQNPYFAHLGNYVVVAPNRPAIEVFIEKYIASQTLAQNTDFLQMAQGFAAEGRAMMVLNGAYLPRMLGQLCQQTSDKSANPDVRRLADSGWLAAEIVPGIGPKLELEFFSQPQTAALPESNIYWKTPLAAPALTPVYSIPQPGMEIATALLVQDKQTQLYCLKPDGSMLWQKHIGSFIMSDIEAVDYFQNGRKCYLFNTKSQVWIVDENGKDVQGYPSNLKTPAIAGLRVVDFDKNMKLNYFVCCENGNVYGFDLYGRTLEGWNPQSNVGKAAAPMLHFQHYGKDYLCFISREGLLSVFGRDGKPRFSAELKGSFSNPLLLDPNNGKAGIIAVNNAGAVFTCDLNGKFREYPAAEKSSGIVQALRVDGEKGISIALLQGKQLTLLKSTAGGLQKSGSFQFSENQDDLFYAEDGLGFCARNKRKITLLDNTAKLRKGFPLAGSTPFGICKLGQQKIVVTGNGSAVYAYKAGE